MRDDLAIGQTDRPVVERLEAVAGRVLATSGMSADDAGADTLRSGTRFLSLAGLLAGAWALVTPYTGPALNTAARVEFADHGVPGLVVVAISILALCVGGRGDAIPFLFPAGLGVILAGFWMTATHLPLVLQATRGEAPWAGAVHHSLPGVAVLTLGVVWALMYRSGPTPES